MAIFTNHKPRLKKVSSGQLFTDNFDRPNGSVGNLWMSYGPDTAEILSNRLRLNATTAGLTTGVSQTVVLPDYTCEVLVKVQTIAKNGTTASSFEIIQRRDNSALVVEIKTGDANPLWSTSKEVSVYVEEGGIRSLVTQTSRTVDTSTEAVLFKVLFTKNYVRVNYLDNNMFVAATEVAATAVVPFDGTQTKVSLAAVEADIMFNDLIIASHEKVYFYGIPSNWTVKANNISYPASLGTIEIDTSLLRTTGTDTFSLSLERSQEHDLFISSDVTSFLVEALGGESYALLNDMRMSTPAGGASAFGLSPIGNDLSRQPVVHLRADHPAVLDVLDYTSSTRTLFPIITDSSGVVFIILQEAETGRYTLHRAFNTVANWYSYKELDFTSLRPNKNTIVWAFFVDTSLRIQSEMVPHYPKIPKDAMSAIAPVIQSVSPDSGTAAGGDTLTITGAGLIDVQSVLFNGVPGTTLVSIDDTSLTIDTPAGIAGQQVYVTVVTTFGRNGDTDTNEFTYV